MKKFGIVCLIITVLVIALPAAADVLWTPVDEYLSHCDYSREDRMFIAAGEAGWAEGVDLPSDPSRVRKFPNGTEFPVSAICGEGDERYAWIRKYRNPWENEYYWPDECFIPMKELAPGYDAAVFEEMHREELQPFTEDYDFCGQETLEVRITPDSPFVLYEKAPGKFDGCRDGQDFRSYYKADIVYVDWDGNRWVPIKDVYSQPDGWINIGQCSVCKLK